MKKANPLLPVGLIFALVGLVFVLIGGGVALFPSGNWTVTVNGKIVEMEPEQAARIFGLCFAGFGVFWMGLGGLFVWLGGRPARNRDELLRFGVREKGVVTDIRIDHTYRVNGRSPLRIMVEAKHPFTGETKTLRAPLVWDATLSTGDAVEVLFDPQDEKKYYVLLPGDGE